MKFEEVYKQYLQGASVSEHQAKFIWNHAVKQIEHKLICNFNLHEHNIIIELCDTEIQENKVPNYFK